MDHFNRGVPRTSVEGFLKALRESNYERAAEYLDLRNLQQGLSADDGPLLARELGVVLDRVLWTELDLLSDSPSVHSDDGLPSYRDYIDSVETGEGRVDILLQRVPRGDGFPSGSSPAPQSVRSQTSTTGTATVRSARNLSRSCRRGSSSASLSGSGFSCLSSSEAPG